MQGEGGYIRIYRSLIDWEWFTDANTAHLWEYICLRVNYEPSRFRGIEIKRGQMLESMATISKRTGLTYKQVRTALDHLKKTGEIECQRAMYGMLITVIKYDDFQCQPDEKGTPKGTQRAREGHAEGTRRATYKEYKEIKEEKEIKNVVGADAPMTPPTPQQAEEYAHEIGFDLDGEHFCDYYSASGWEIRNGIPMKDWKAAIRNWKRKDTKQETRKETQNEKHDGVFERESDYSKPIDWLERK